MRLDKVVFDWRGTLAVPWTLSTWVAEGLAATGQEPTVELVDQIVSDLNAADPDGSFHRGSGVYTDAALHRRVYLTWMGRAGLSSELAETLYKLESDWHFNPFAADVPHVLFTLHKRGIKVAILSDIHFDIRPAFADLDILGTVDVFALSSELRMQKPDPRLFSHVFDELGAEPENVLMVGDGLRSDRLAADLGVTTLLLPRLSSPDQRRLHGVLRLTDDD